jgi:hypothetical protein
VRQPAKWVKEIDEMWYETRRCNVTELKIESHLRIDILTVAKQELWLGQVLRHARRGDGAGVELRNVLAEIERNLNERCLAAIPDRVAKWNVIPQFACQWWNWCEKVFNYSKSYSHPKFAFHCIISWTSSRTDWTGRGAPSPVASTMYMNANIKASKNMRKPIVWHCGEQQNLRLKGWTGGIQTCQGRAQIWLQESTQITQRETSWIPGARMMSRTAPTAPTKTTATEARRLDGVNLVDIIVFVVIKGLDFARTRRAGAREWVEIELIRKSINAGSQLLLRIVLRD